MRVLISGIGDHDPKDHHYMLVENHGFLIDLRGVKGTLVDPAITQVEWDVLHKNGERREGGVITRRDGTKQTFFDKALIQPYIDAWKAKKAQLEAPAPVEVSRESA